MNSTDFSLKVNGYPIQEAKKKLIDIQKRNEKDYSNYILEQKKKIVTFHLKNNLFYKNKCNNEFTSWEKLPVLTKKDLQIPLQERLSNGYTLKNIYLNKTSGSTGNPFYFAKDKFSHALTWAVIENRFNWLQLYGKKQARFYGLPKNIFSRLKERLKDLVTNRYRFDVFDLSEKNFEQWLVKFKQNKFIFLNGYTTVIVAFANYLQSQNIILKDICPTLKACVVTSEMCFDTDKAIMEKHFGIPVINEYGASELDLIAFQNTNNDWILNSDTLFVEVLDSQNKPLPYGEVGKLVITSLYNKAHPFIRYELGDLGSIQKISESIFILEKLEGRREDIVQLPSGKTVPGLSFYYITKSVMKDNGQIKEIKALQTAINTFEIHYTATKILSEKEIISIKKALLKYLEPNLKVVFLKFEQLERSKIGKLKQFTSLIK